MNSKRIRTLITLGLVIVVGLAFGLTTDSFFTTGNITQLLRDAAYIGTIAIGMSVFVNLAFTTAAALTGVYILEILPMFILDAFDFCLPAILGAVLAQYWRKNKLFVPVIFVICLVLQLLPIPSFLRFPGAIIISIILGIFQYNNHKKKAAA